MLLYVKISKHEKVRNGEHLRKEVVGLNKVKIVIRYIVCFICVAIILSLLLPVTAR
jgi:hypothetical protein